MVLDREENAEHREAVQRLVKKRGLERRVLPLVEGAMRRCDLERPWQDAVGFPNSSWLK